MKYLGILLVVALVLVGSVAMALGAYNLSRWGGVDTGRFNGTSYSVPVTLQVWVYPYLYLNIDYTNFRWHLYEASAGETYPSDDGANVATARIKTNWPEVQLVFSGFGDPARGSDKIEAWWGLNIDNMPGFPYWKKASEIDSNTWTKAVPVVGSEVEVEILNKIKLPSNNLKTGQYTNTGTITATLPQSYWP